MSKSNRYPYNLAELALFADCTRSELDLVGTLLTPVTVEAGSVLMREGSPAREAFILSHGSAEVTCTDGETTRSLGVAVDGDPLGEMALLTRQPRMATVTTLTDTTLYVVTPAEFSSLLERVPSFEARIMATAKRRQQANLAA